MSERTNLIDIERRRILKDELQATDDEFNSLERLIEISKEKRNSSEGSRYYPSIIIDDFLYLGDLGHAIDYNLLSDNSIKNILNVCDCQLDESMNDLINIHWIEDLQDHPQANIRRFFDRTNLFLSQCKQRNEKVLVHCQAGISRSSTIVLAYLIKFVSSSSSSSFDLFLLLRYNHFTLEEAYRYLLKRRPIISPNYGFLLELIRYEKEIHSSTTV